VHPYLIVSLAVMDLWSACVWGDLTPPVKTLLEMRRENVVIQKWDISCGAAALGTLLNHQHGDMVSEREIAAELMKRSEYQENPELVKLRMGFSLLDLKRYVDDRGYAGVGFGKLTLDDLEQKAPIMVVLQIHGYNHFVVFRGRYGNRVLLADPAWGNRTMSIERFMDVWSDFPTLGRIGLTVEQTDPDLRIENHALLPTPEDFVSLH
jgi:predicted double-glycine peptidase